MRVSTCYNHTRRGGAARCERGRGGGAHLCSATAISHSVNVSFPAARRAPLHRCGAGKHGFSALTWMPPQCDLVGGWVGFRQGTRRSSVPVAPLICRPVRVAAHSPQPIFLLHSLQSFHPQAKMQLARLQRSVRPAAKGVSRARCTRAMAYKVTLKTPSGEPVQRA